MTRPLVLRRSTGQWAVLYALAPRIVGEVCVAGTGYRVFARRSDAVDFARGVRS